MLDAVLPQLAVLVADTQPEVRIAAGETLVDVARWVKPADLGTRVLTIVLRLAHDDEQEDLRMTAAVLLNELAQVLGAELCHQFVTPEIICLAEDPVFRVRKAAALNMDAVCMTAGQEKAGNRLLPVFLRLAQDEIWGVRKACAESLMAVSRSLHPSVRASELIPQFERFVADDSKWVRETACQHLGPFISTLQAAKVTPSLLAHFCAMAGTNKGSDSHHSAHSASPLSEVAYCAFSFPAVAQTLGPSRWPELSELFNKLARDTVRQVRKPIAHCLHELAHVLGPDMADKELVPVFELYLQDVDEVKEGVLRNLSRFLAALSPGMRESFLPVLDDVEISSSSLNWRFRFIMAQQLNELSVLFSPAATFSVVRRLALRLLGDPIHEVRLEASRRLAPLLMRCNEADPLWMQDFVAELLAMTKSASYKPRLTMAHAVVHLSQTWDRDMFVEHMLAPAEQLALDPVRNVRLVLARWLADCAVGGHPAQSASPSAGPSTAAAASSGGRSVLMSSSQSQADRSSAVAGAQEHEPELPGPLSNRTFLLTAQDTSWIAQNERIVQLIEQLQNDVDDEVKAVAGGVADASMPTASASGEDKHEPDGDDAVLGEN